MTSGRELEIKHVFMSNTTVTFIHATCPAGGDISAAAVSRGHRIQHKDAADLAIDDPWDEPLVRQSESALV